jgi:hypothetical protein
MSDDNNDEPAENTIQNQASLVNQKSVVVAAAVKNGPVEEKP